MKISEEALIKECSHNLEYLRQTLKISEPLNQLSIEYNIDFNLTELNELIYFNSLITISKLDLAIILKNLRLSNSKWENIYFIKSAYLTINETIESFNSHRKKLNDITSKYQKFKNVFLVIEKELKQFKKEYQFETKLKFVRNKTIAHIDQDFKLYYDELLKLNKKDTIKMIQTFIIINIKYLELSANLLNAK